MISLRPYQEEVVAAAMAAQSGVVVLPTASGKTICFAEQIRLSQKRALILAHRDELLQQAADKLRMVWREAEIGVVKAERNEIDCRVTIGSVQTLRGARLATMPAPELLIVDEAHHSSADSYARIFEAFPDAQRIGFTATPERTDGDPIAEAPGAPFEKIIYRKTLTEMIAAGYLCDIRNRRIGVSGFDLAGVKRVRGDYSEGALGEEMLRVGAPARAAEAYLEHAKGRKAIAFLPTVATAEATLAELLKRGVAAGMVSGDQPLEERRETLRRFSSGDLQVLTNCAVLLEGYDEPSISCIIMARPTRSRLLYMQAIGRGTRIYPEKEDCLVLDLVGAGALADEKQQTLARALGLSEATAEKGVEAAVAEAEAAGGVAAEGAPAFDRRGLHWIHDGPRYLLSCGQETLILFATSTDWRVSSLRRGDSGGPKLLWEGLTLEYAQGSAEDYARNLGALPLASAVAAWRKAPASIGQRETLQRWGRWREGMSKGEASDAITVGSVRGAEKRRWR